MDSKSQCCGYGYVFTDPDPGFFCNPDPDPDPGFQRQKQNFGRNFLFSTQKVDVLFLFSTNQVGR